MILYLNACVRSESRTKRLADHVLTGLNDKDVKEVRLWELNLPDPDEAFINKRNDLSAKSDFADPIFEYAKDFAAADTILIAAPFWDLSFPAFLNFN